MNEMKMSGSKVRRPPALCFCGMEAADDLNGRRFEWKIIRYAEKSPSMSTEVFHK